MAGRGKWSACGAIGSGALAAADWTEARVSATMCQQMCERARVLEAMRVIREWNVLGGVSADTSSSRQTARLWQAKGATSTLCHQA